MRGRLLDWTQKRILMKEKLSMLSIPRKSNKKKSMAAKEKSIADNLTSTRMECAHQRKKTFLGLPKEI